MRCRGLRNGLTKGDSIGYKYTKEFKGGPDAGFRFRPERFPSYFRGVFFVFLRTVADYREEAAEPVAGRGRPSRVRKRLTRR